MPASGPSLINPEAGREGVVLLPLAGGWRVPQGTSLIFKTKAEDFKERPARSPVRDLAPEAQARAQYVDALKRGFRACCTASRMYSLASRLGAPASSHDYGRCAGPFIADAWADFVQDNPGLALAKGEERAVKNIGSLGYEIFCRVAASMQQDTGPAC